MPHEMEKGKSSGWYDLFPDAQRCHVCIANTQMYNGLNTG